MTVNMMIGNASMPNMISDSKIITAYPLNSGEFDLEVPSSLAGQSDELLITIQIEVAGVEMQDQESYYWSGT